MSERNRQVHRRGFSGRDGTFSHAIKYAEQGYEVFPLIPGRKVPITSSGCNNATTNIGQIKRWIEDYPDANIGIKAGTDVLIIDIDNKDGRNGSDDLAKIEKELGNLPNSPKAETPTGGFHLYFKHPGVDVKGQAGVEWKGRKTGIDIRVGNQYVVAPDSLHPDTKTKYQWGNVLVHKNDIPELPQAWIDKFLPLRDKEVATVKPATKPSKTITETPRTVFPLTINGEAEKQFVKYLDTCPKAIQGRSGHNTLCSIARAGVRGYALEPQRAADIAWEYYNFFCSPFWTEAERKDFDRKFHEATKWNCPKPDGWMIKETGMNERSNLAWERFPIECFPPVMRDFCLAVAIATNTDPAYIATFILPIIASAIGSHIVAEVKRGWNPPAIIWGLVVADSGSCKTHTWRLATKPLIKKQGEFSKQYEKEEELYRIEKNKYDADLYKSKKSHTAPPVKPEPPKRQFCYVSDTTTEMLIPILADNPYGGCSCYNEATTFFGSLDAYRSGGGGKDEGIYNDIYDGGYVQVTRKTGNQFIAAEHSHCSFMGGIQPESLKTILTKNPQFFYSGFLARFLLCMPPDTPKHLNKEPVPEDVENAYNGMINTLFSWRKKAKATPAAPCCLPLTPEAMVLFEEYHDELADERASLPSGTMKANLSKLSGYVMRIALTLHIADFASTCSDGKVPKRIPRIDEKAMQAAITLTQWYRREAQRILLMVRPNEVVTGDKEVAAILGHLKKHGKTDARKVAQNIKAFGGAGGTDKATEKLEGMVKTGLLIADDQSPTKRVYSLPSTAYAKIAPAPDDTVGVCRRVVGGKKHANSNENKELEQSVGVVGGVGDPVDDETDEDSAVTETSDPLTIDDNARSKIVHCEGGIPY